MSEELEQSIDAPAEEISASGIAADAAPACVQQIHEPPTGRRAFPRSSGTARAGAIRTDALLKSYVELERKLGSMVPLPGDDDQEGRERLRRALGVPAAAERLSDRGSRRAGGADAGDQRQAA